MTLIRALSSPIIKPNSLGTIFSNQSQVIFDASDYGAVRWFDGRNLTAAMGSNLDVAMPDSIGLLSPYNKKNATGPIIQGNDAGGRWLYGPQDGTDRRVFASTNTSSANTHIFALIKMPDDVSTSFWALAGPGSAYFFGLDRDISGDNKFYPSFYYGPDGFSGSVGFALNTWVTLELETNGTAVGGAGGTRTMYVNGVSAGSSTSFTQADFIVQHLMGGNSSNQSGMRLADSQVYDISGGVLNAAARSAIRSYTASRAAKLISEGF